MNRTTLMAVFTALAMVSSTLATASLPAPDDNSAFIGQYRTGDKITITAEDGTKTEWIVGRNLAENGQFDYVSAEGNIYGWTVGSYADMTTNDFIWRPTGGHDGGAYIQATTGAGPDALVSIVQRWTLASNKPYYMSYWVKGLTDDKSAQCPVISITSKKSIAGGENEYDNGTTLVGKADGDETGTSIGNTRTSADGAWTNTAFTFSTTIRRYLQFNARWLTSKICFDDVFIAQLYDASTADADSIRRMVYADCCSDIETMLKVKLRNYTALNAEASAIYEANKLGDNPTAADYDKAIAALHDLPTRFTVAVNDNKTLADKNKAIETLINDITTNPTSYPGSINLDELSKALEIGKEALNGTVAGLTPAIKQAQAAIDESKAIIKKYDALLRAMNQLRDIDEDYEDMANVQIVLNKAQGVYDNKEYNTDVMEQMMIDLQATYAAYLQNRPSSWVTIKNGNLWYDNRNRSVQAHGAGFVQVGDTWYMIGEDRSSQWNPDVNMYSTKDFVNWKFERKIIQNGVTNSDLGRSRFIERPKILYCAKTGKYVVWCHWEQSNYGASEAACFQCETVNGAYEFVWSGRPLDVKSRDCTAFVDDDGTAYFISTTNENQDIGLFRLSDDYLSVVEHTVLFKGQQREAPAVVKVGEYYFMIFSACSGWDPNQASYSYSKSLKTGWSSRRNIGNDIAWDTQAASILKVQGSSGTTLLYVGDRWQDSNLPNSKTIIFPITITGTTITFPYKHQFDIDFATGKVRDTETHYVDKTNWHVIEFSSQETTSAKSYASNAIDGNPATIWHSKYSSPAASAPHYITVDMGSVRGVEGFLATPRSDNSSSGLIRDYKLELSMDGVTWTRVSNSSWMLYWTEVSFTPTAARYFRFTVPSGDIASLAEFDLIENEAVAIPSIENENTSNSNGVYDLTGRKVADSLHSLKPGIYIHEGKKVMIR